MDDGGVPERYPGYDVLSKWHSPSWNRKTREIIGRRLIIDDGPHFFTPDEYATVAAIAARIVPQKPARPKIPVVALVDHKLHADKDDGYRIARLPRHREAWRLGLKALDAEAQRLAGKKFAALDSDAQDMLLSRMQSGDLHEKAWSSMPPHVFFKGRMAKDIVFAYYSHPIAWSQIGWGGPASPRGYVRLGYDERDPWEAAEVKNGNVHAARLKNFNVG